jgi:hypothetical protein
VPPMTDADFDAKINRIIDDVIAEDLAKRLAVEQRKRAADAAALADLGPLPARVRIQQHSTDNTRPCDDGREGWVRSAPVPSVNGAVTYLHVEDLTPGDDDNPSRYYFPRHVVRIT